MGIFGPPNVDRMMRNEDVEGLIKALGYQKEYQVRRKAAEALGQLGDVLAVEPLINTLKDESKFVRSSAADALGEMEDDRAVKPLSAALKDEEELVRMAAVNTLAKIGGERVVKSLISAFDDKEFKIKEAAMNALVKIGPPAVESLMKMLKGKRIYEVKERAVKTLGQIGDLRAVEPLIALLEDKSAPGIEVTTALGRIGDPRAVKPLIAELTEKAKYYHESVEKALIQIGAPSIEPLVAVLCGKSQSEADGDLRFKVAYIINRLYETGSYAESFKKPIPSLIDVVCSDNESFSDLSVRRTVAKILVDLYKKGLLEEPLKKLIRDQRKLIISHADRVKEQVREVIKGGCAEVVKVHTDNGIGVDFPL